MTNTPSSDETLFAAALARSPTERAAFLDGACGGDVARREKILGLLRAHGEAEQKFLRTGARANPAAPTAPAAGERIGRYKLLQNIGEGGCGTVYMAEQEEPVRRRVALKVIKLGMDTREVIARFDAERQALALMDHPNIAKVLDAGATGAGRPYFVMELVRGLPITRFCDEKSLAAPARIELFIKVCQAVQHAHQKGIIHRDIKPSNILVTLHDGIPTPKVIDFGIAKATQGKLTDATLFTAFEQFIGTPAYMSPEQAEMSGLDVDTRSDIYSLGVLLYELLTGRPPFDPKTLVAAGLDEIRRIIREVEPPRPSTRLSTLNEADRETVARQRSIPPNQLSTLLRGDLDWIVMRCLEKQCTRRYETANDLAADLLRHLSHEPVTARPPNTVYVLRKLFRRHRLAVVAGAAVVAALVIGIAASTWQAVRATQAEKLAETRLSSELAARQEVEAQRQLALDRLGAEQKARQETEHQKTLAEHERNRAQSAEKLAEDRLQAASLARSEAEQQKILADQQRGLAEQQRALAEQQRSLAELERNRAREAEHSAQTEAARSAEAARLMQNMLKGAGPHVALVSDTKELHHIVDEAARRLIGDPPGEAQVELRDALTAVYYDLGNYATSAAIGGKWTGKDHPPLAPALNQLGNALAHRGWMPQAVAVLREAVAVDRLVSVAGTGRSESLTMIADLVRGLRLAGKTAEADQLDRELQERREAIGRDTAANSPEQKK